MLRLTTSVGKPAPKAARQPRQRRRAGLAALRVAAGRVGRLAPLRELDLLEPDPDARRAAPWAAPVPVVGAALLPESADLSEGLSALVQRPGNAASWNGPYIKTGSVPADPWGRPYS